MNNGKTQTKRALLGMPGYGEHTAGAGRALWRASRGLHAKVPLDLQVSYSEGSLLAQNFNALWCRALNDCLKGETVHYFAMLHADVEPEDFWLDALIDELEATGLDVLGTVVPIKDHQGLTSLALDRDDGDTWRPLCRLTMREVFRLPETFTSADVGGHRLLLNTGCWVCRFDPEWAKQVRFTINDRIVFNAKLGMYQAQVEPEDWYFSRLCHELGLKVGATRKIRLAHAGKMRFHNAEPWGSAEFDETYVPASVLPAAAAAELPAEVVLPEGWSLSQVEPDQDGFRFPDDVEGWLSRDEGEALAELARGKRVLEIGSYCGKSTVCLAQTAEHVTAVDPFDGRGTPSPKPTRGAFEFNLNRYGVGHKVHAVTGTVEDVAAWEPPADLFDLVFIDGAHDLASVRNDVAHALRLLKPGGLLAFHDYRERPGDHDGRWDAGVTAAVGELLVAGGEILSTHSTLAVVKPPQLPSEEVLQWTRSTVTATP